MTRTSRAPEAASAFADELSVTKADDVHSGDEDRYVLTGLSVRQRLVVVAHAERVQNVRIISARLATPREREPMSKETESDMLPEYDFSGGVRGKYSGRFEQNRDEFLSAAAALDRQAWLSHSLLAVQRLEANLVAYWSLALDEGPAAARRKVSALLELLDPRALKKLERDLDKHTSVGKAFHEDFRQLIGDRNWLVHHSFHSPSSSRLESISDRSKMLGDQIFEFLLERCTSKGMDRSEIMARTNEVVEEWASGRSAA